MVNILIKMKGSIMNSLAHAFKYGRMTLTENGALTHASSLNKVLDFYSRGGACRLGHTDSLPLFINAWNEDKIITLKTLFYLRDVRQGQGERQVFRSCLQWIFDHDITTFHALIPFIAEYGRFDDILQFPIDSFVVEYVKHVLRNDLDSNNPSLLAKWMPSENTSSKNTRALALQWIQALGMTARNYRKMLSHLRAELRIVERSMSSKEFSAIEYEHVPSLAMKRYRKAFDTRDNKRFSQYLSDVESGKEKINAGVLYPYELYEAVSCTNDPAELRVLENLWRALPDYMVDDQNILVIADVSGSMKGTPLSVSVSLALYAAERGKGAFKNIFMTFSSDPEIVCVKGETLQEKMGSISNANWGMSTNIQAAFDTVLEYALRYHVPLEDMPTMLFIISDMEFDIATEDRTNFEVIDQKYAQAGYNRPMIVFWNVASRGGRSPVTVRDDNTILVSGLSPVIFKNTLQAKMTTPYDAMLAVLNSDRYSFIDSIMSEL